MWNLFSSCSLCLLYYESFSARIIPSLETVQLCAFNKFKIEKYSRYVIKFFFFCKIERNVKSVSVLVSFWRWRCRARYPTVSLTMLNFLTNRIPKSIVFPFKPMYLCSAEIKVQQKSSPLGENFDIF